MAVAVTEDLGSSLQKGLSEWWNEETEYVFQRIERWAALARGYNRLRSQRLSRGRLTMQEEQESRWSISSNKLVIDDPSWSPHFHTMKRSHRRKSRPEETKINCCGTFNYQSNGDLDSTCLETYRYDHSIYFKTVGEIRSSRKDPGRGSDQEEGSVISDEQVEWEVRSVPILGGDRGSFQDRFENNNRYEEPDFGYTTDRYPDSEDKFDDVQPSWPIVDLGNLSLNVDNESGEMENGTEQTLEVEIEDTFEWGNNNNIDSGFDEAINEKDNIEKSWRTRRSPARVRQSVVSGDNNVTWPGVLLNYTKNIDPITSPHHHAINAK
ncbi:uncharacterized protein LOC105703313 [Orussus abietinus]|uniref:uncharacterized protein LOC105703313 n=1 Tax=Orussus abietinus TaxID=222816 RepID=UPI0006269938|nr:uncharacterized protein LOC105703313 [Orussus abietinus]